MINKKHHILILEGYCKQVLPFIRGFKDLGCIVSVLCGSKWDCAYVSRLPDYRVLGVCDLHRPKESEDYIVKLIKTGMYDIVIPMFDMSARILAHHKEELSEYAIIIANDKEIFDKANDKSEVMSICLENGIPCPKTLSVFKNLVDIKDYNLSFPVIIKPRSSYGARGFRVFNSFDQLQDHVLSNHIIIEDYVIQEYIPSGSSLITAVIYIDRFGGIKSAYLYKSEHFYPLEGGTSTLNGILNRPDILDCCKKLALAMELKGLIGVDLMIDCRDNIGKVIEINPRSVHGITLGFISGVNHAQQLLEDAKGEDVTSMMIESDDMCCRILQTDILWWLHSPDRFKLTPKKLGYQKVKEQMFYWDDPLPWMAFLFDGIKNYRKKMMEKKGY